MSKINNILRVGNKDIELKLLTLRNEESVDKIKETIQRDVKVNSDDYIIEEKENVSVAIQGKDDKFLILTYRIESKIVEFSMLYNNEEYKTLEADKNELGFIISEIDKVISGKLESRVELCGDNHSLMGIQHSDLCKFDLIIDIGTKYEFVTFESYSQGTTKSLSAILKTYYRDISSI